MILRHTKADDDLKFMVYYYCRDAVFVKANVLCLETEDAKYETLDEIAEHIFALAGEEFSTRRLGEFKRSRSHPTQLKGDIGVMTLVNYINLVRTALESGTLKNKEYIDSITSRISVSFDPDFCLMEIRAGRIESIDCADGMDRLFCENVNAGRSCFVCSALRGVYEKDDLLGNTYLFLLNIRKAKFKTLESEGMICCVEGERPEAIGIDKKEGSRISVDGFLDVFEDVVYGKVDFTKSTYRAIFAEFRVIDNLLTFKGRRVLCGGEPVRTTTANGAVK